MARLKFTASVGGGWQDSDELVVLVGTENAASLAASDPVGGSIVRTVTVANAKLTADPQQVRIEYDYAPTDKCATLPVGLAIRDPAGNTSAVSEDLIQLRDPPLGVGRPTAAATVNPNEALLTWDLSPDVN